MIRPSFSEAKERSNGYTIMPISMEIFSDLRTSVEVLRTLMHTHKKCYLLESVMQGESWGRYSFLGYDPKLTISCDDHLVTLDNGLKETTYFEDPMDAVQQILDAHKSPQLEDFPPFAGGLVGYFSYDCIQYGDMHLTLENENANHFDDYHLMLFDKIIAFDHFRQKIYLIVNIETADFEENYICGVQLLKDMAHMILEPIPRMLYDGHVTSPITPLFSKEDFCTMVEKVKEHIYEGDLMQCVLSNRFEASFEGSLLETFRRLRTTNPSPYMFYIHFGDTELVGASPETLANLKNGVATTFALAGTCPRGNTPEDDAEKIAALLENEKELAEHNMLVDLSRNDLGRVCEFDSVHVTEYKKILKFSHVSHIASVVQGKLLRTTTALDLLKSLLPAGTLSGAPKKKACELINQLEKTKRGVYGGAVGYLDFTGNMDLCIGIRLVRKQNGKIFIQSGAGIVADSIPEKEYEETLHKSAALLKLFTEKQEDIL